VSDEGPFFGAGAPETDNRDGAFAGERWSWCFIDDLAPARR